MHENKISKLVEEHVIKFFKTQGPSENIYHDLRHTEEVVESALHIGKHSGLNEEELEILTIAAWFHDSGYAEKSEGHEEISANNAERFLKERNYPADKIEKVKGCIRATKVPQSPKNLLEEVICDADLHHFGQENFFRKSELLRVEAEHRGNKMFDELDWLEDNIDFLTRHKFFTKYARENYEEQKNEHILKLQKKLRKKHKKLEKEKLTEDKLSLEKEKFEKKKEDDKKAGRSVETMFRNVMRTHVSFSAMADNKANIMISVNTIIITIIVSVMLRKLDNNPHLIIPTAIITFVSLVTLVFAILVTRPTVTEGRFTKEDIKNKKANLLFFGNFYNMDLKDFEWGMSEMIEDRNYLYGSMIKDFYFLGLVLGKKYRYLRICYTIFMFGLVVSVIAYAIAFAMYPEGTNIGNILE